MTHTHYLDVAVCVSTIITIIILPGGAYREENEEESCCRSPDDAQNKNKHLATSNKHLLSRII